MTESQDAQDRKPRITLRVTTGSKDDDIQTFNNNLKLCQDHLSRHKDGGPDLFLVEVIDPRVVDIPAEDPNADKILLHYWVAFAPGKPPHTETEEEEGSEQYIRCVLAGEVMILDMTYLSAEDWQKLAAALTEDNELRGLTVPFTLEQKNYFPVAGGYVRPIYGLSARPEDLPLLQEFYAPQTPLNWAVGLAMFALTDEDKVRSGSFQEVRIDDLVDMVFQITERDVPRRDNQKTDILAEVVKLHSQKNWYYEVELVRVGRAWQKRAVIGSQYAIPELQMVFVDTKTGKRTLPSDREVRAAVVPLMVKGRRVAKPDGKNIPALPPDRWRLESIRWRWVQSFNEDLLLTPALVEEGRRKGLPKTTTGGKAIRKGYLIQVAANVFRALRILRAEGRGSLYACRLLVMLAHDINRRKRPEIAADRVFRMLGIGEDYTSRTHRKPEDLVADAVLRLKQRDIGALLAGSDEFPRTDPNADRRKGPYYRFVLAPAYMPKAGLTTREDALTIEAEFQDAPVEGAAEGPAAAAGQRAAAPGPAEEQTVLPGMTTPAVPSGAAVRAAREAAGLTLREFARYAAGPDFSTWSRYEAGKAIRVDRIPEAVWTRVRDFVNKHPKKTPQSTQNEKK